MMQLIKQIVLLIIVTPVLGGYSQNTDTLIDVRDGQTYAVTKIGGKIWMAENLNYSADKSWCYKNDAENCKVYGRLYTLDAAMSACPAGWHLPSDAEWQDLEKYLGMNDSELVKNNAWRGTNQGLRLLSDTTIGFNVLLGGYRNPPSNYNIKDMQAFFWTSTELWDQFYMRQIYINSPQIFRRQRPRSWGFSVRCIKDEQK